MHSRRGLYLVLQFAQLVADSIATSSRAAAESAYTSAPVLDVMIRFRREDLPVTNAPLTITTVPRRDFLVSTHSPSAASDQP